MCVYFIPTQNNHTSHLHSKNTTSTHQHIHTHAVFTQTDFFEESKYLTHTHTHLYPSFFFSCYDPNNPNTYNNLNNPNHPICNPLRTHTQPTYLACYCTKKVQLAPSDLTALQVYSPLRNKIYMVNNMLQTTSKKQPTPLPSYPYTPCNNHLHLPSLPPLLL